MGQRASLPCTEREHRWGSGAMTETSLSTCLGSWALRSARGAPRHRGTRQRPTGNSYKVGERQCPRRHRVRDGAEGTSRGNSQLHSNEKPPELVAPQVTMSNPVPTQFPGTAKLPSMVWDLHILKATHTHPIPATHTQRLSFLSPNPTVTSTS